MMDNTNESKSEFRAQVQHVLHIIWKWKWMVLATFVTSVAIVTIYSFSVDPVFTAKGSIWVEGTANILPFEDVQTSSRGAGLEGHIRILQSRALAAEIIAKLKLYENPDFANYPNKDGKAIEPDDPILQGILVKRFLDCLEVTSTQSGSYEPTQLIDVTFSNRNPKLAAEILNALFDGYIDMFVRKRFAASEMATEFLTAQITELRTTIEQKEKELSQYGEDKNILPLTAAEAPTIARIEEVNKALTAVTIEKVSKLNIYNQLKNAPLGEIPDAPFGSLIQTLRGQYVTLSRQYATRLATVRPEYPEMQRLKTELDSATEALTNETQNLIRVAYSDYQTALNRERSLQNLLNDLKDKAYNTNSSSVVFNSLRIELDNKKALLEALSKRQSETDVSSRLRGLEALNVWIVDKADYPLSPTSPNKRRNILLGIILGMAGGIGLALGLEYLNHTVKTSKDVMNSIGVPTLGSIPSFETETSPKGPIAQFAKMISVIKGKSNKKEARAGRRRNDRNVRFLEPDIAKENPVAYEIGPGKIELIAAREPQSIQAESYRSIRTTLLVSSPPGRVKTMLFTSPLAREGKSSTVSNMAITLAESGKRVVIMDSDLRKPKQARIFRANNGEGPGLSRFLSSNIEPTEVVKPTDIPNLHLITSGPLPANPIELLTSEKMDSLIGYLKRNFDFILLDTPPILAVSDALAMGPMADAIILVARGGQTPIQAIKQAKQKLDAHKLKCLGVILNGVDLIEQDGYYAREYYSYSKAE